jgi:hypothetical protein
MHTITNFNTTLLILVGIAASRALTFIESGGFLGVFARIHFIRGLNFLKIVGKAISVVIIAVAVLGMYSVNGPVWDQIFKYEPPENHRNNTFAQTQKDAVINQKGYMYEYFMQNEGIQRCYNPYDFVTAARGYENTGYTGEAYVENNAGNASITYFSPNVLKVHVELGNSSRLIVNQNFDFRWRSDAGEVTNYENLLSVNVPKDTENVTFYYLPSSFIAGLFVSIIGAIICVVFYKRQGITNVKHEKNNRGLAVHEKARPKLLS